MIFTLRAELAAHNSTGEVAEIALLIAQKAMHERFDPRKHEELVTLAVEAFEARNQAGAP